jgi:Integron Cassette Protein Hfx_Cass5
MSLPRGIVRGGSEAAEQPDAADDAGWNSNVAADLGVRHMNRGLDHVDVVEISAGPAGRLVVAVNEDFSFIYRAAMEVNWSPETRSLVGGLPREWSKARWFQQIVLVWGQSVHMCRPNLTPAGGGCHICHDATGAALGTYNAGVEHLPHRRQQKISV